ncbi:MAG: nitroreductase family protein [Caldilineales bacterium]|nr:nitroreductase family protein [Caldilineales bacterium]
MNHLLLDQLLTTTRSVRKRLDFDRPLAPEIVQECLEIAIQAPTASNEQGYHFVIVSDPAQRAAVAAHYQKAFMIYASMRSQTPRVYEASDPRAAHANRVAFSALYLAQNMARAPYLVLPCVEGRVEGSAAVLPQASLYGSILPAAWSFMLALRARGVGAAWTTLHLMFEREVAAILGIPDTITQTALLPVAYFLGEDFKPASRIPARARTYWDRWEQTR